MAFQEIRLTALHSIECTARTNAEQRKNALKKPEKIP